MIARPLATLAVCQMDLHPIGNQTEENIFKVPGLGGVDYNHHHDNKMTEVSPRAMTLNLYFTDKENKAQRWKWLVQAPGAAGPQGPVWMTFSVPLTYMQSRPHVT